MTVNSSLWRPVIAFLELVVGFAVLFGTVHGPSTWWMVFGLFCLGTGYLDMTRISVVQHLERVQARLGELETELAALRQRENGP